MGSPRKGLLILALAGAGCDAPQIVALSCGDRRVDAPEVCDDGDQNGTPGHCRADCSGIPELVAIEGDVLLFGEGAAVGQLAGAKVSILELPQVATTSDQGGHFRFEDVESGTSVTLVVEDDAVMTTLSPTIRLGDGGVYPFVLHAMPKEVAASWDVDAGGCTVVVGASRLGDNAYTDLRLRVPGAIVGLEPVMNAVPIYLDSSGVPNPALEATSEAGMALFRDIRTGEFEITATNGSRRFSKAKIVCQPGVVVLADTPFGPLEDVSLPDHALGAERPADGYSDATDALCTRTAACVASYPTALVASCEAAYDNIWSWFSPNCDAEHAARNALKALVDCRAASCDTAIEADTCPDEAAAFDAALEVYGSCVSGV